nr:hypothetical protein Iba_chr01dCG2360 [Ipomoea batatas]
MAVLISDMKDGIFAITSGTESLFSVKAPERSFWPISMVYNAPAKSTWLSIPVLLDYRGFVETVLEPTTAKLTPFVKFDSKHSRKEDKVPEVEDDGVFHALRPRKGRSAKKENYHQSDPEKFLHT